MLLSTLSTTGQALLLAALCLAALMLVGILHRRAAAQDRRLHDSIDNMSQGFLMYDAQGRLVLCNRRYIEMYGLSPQVVRPGCSLQEVLRHRKETGLFAGDPDAYSAKILAAMAKGERTEQFVQASDGRIVLAKNVPRFDGWLTG